MALIFSDKHSQFTLSRLFSKIEIALLFEDKYSQSILSKLFSKIEMALIYLRIWSLKKNLEKNANKIVVFSQWNEWFIIKSVIYFDVSKLFRSK